MGMGRIILNRMRILIVGMVIMKGMRTMKRVRIMAEMNRITVSKMRLVIVGMVIMRTMRKTMRRKIVMLRMEMRKIIMKRMR
jgi:hypothetical protein